MYCSLSLNTRMEVLYTLMATSASSSPEGLERVAWYTLASLPVLMAPCTWSTKPLFTILNKICRVRGSKTSRHVSAWRVTDTHSAHTLVHSGAIGAVFARALLAAPATASRCS